MTDSTKTDWVAVVRELGARFAERARAHDESDAFVAENFADLRQKKLFSAHVPAELGGGGATYLELCAVIRELAHHCGSTALSFSMHSHVVATARWRLQYQQAPMEPILRRCAAEELVLVSSGASDWLDSSGTLEKVDGGFRLNGSKAFASGSPGGHLMMTSAVYQDPNEGLVVCHFGLPLKTEGLKILDNWRPLGMRGTGSNDVVFENVFIPDAAVVARRPRGKWIGLFDLLCGIVLPPILATYVGIAEAASELAVREAAPKRADIGVQMLVGEMETALTTAQVLFESVAQVAQDLTAIPTTPQVANLLARKTAIIAGAIRTVEKAMEIFGGKGYLRSFPIERMYRDVHAARFHPFPEQKQRIFTGRVMLGLPPVG